ncbi:hypothetical protein [Puia sp.]|jgi:hypothetical protein|uniref:hypothetical protein n=1 Tax=Puia sp. TaxID=2045100 RepID=UPI002F42BADC
MKKQFYRWLSLAIVLNALSGCGGPRDHLWFYSYGSGPGRDTTGELTPASFIELRPDGSYTLDFGRYEYGSWNRKEDQLFLTSQQHKTYVYAMKLPTPKEMELVVAKGRTGHFESRPFPSDNRTEDPFSAENNRWRLPATHKETDAEIKQRLYNHCKFWEYYFKWALDKKLNMVDVRSTPTAIKIYGNGFGLKPYEELPDRWKAFFFDEEDCRKANDMIQDIFRHKTIAWANTDSKYKMFLGAFQQMEEFLR